MSHASYEAFDPGILPILFYYFGLTVFGFIMTAIMYRKWKERKRTPTLLMTAVFAILTLALIMLTVGVIDAAITGVYGEVYEFSIPFSYSMYIIADIVLYKFANIITDRGKRVFKLIIPVGIAICIMAFLPWNYWGAPKSAYVGHVDIRIYSMLCILVFSSAIYIWIGRACWHAKADADTPVAKAGLLLMVWSMIWLIFYLIMFVCDAILILYFNSPGYSVFVYVAWVFAVLFYIFMYLSVGMPAWLVQRITR